MVLALMSKRVNMVNVGHGVMELELMSKRVNMIIIKWIIQYGSIQVTDRGVNKTRFIKSGTGNEKCPNKSMLFILEDIIGRTLQWNLKEIITMYCALNARRKDQSLVLQ
jgi:hypothetical protein